MIAAYDRSGLWSLYALLRQGCLTAIGFCRNIVDLAFKFSSLLGFAKLPTKNISVIPNESDYGKSIAYYSKNGIKKDAEK